MGHFILSDQLIPVFAQGRRHPFSSRVGFRTPLNFLKRPSADRKADTLLRFFGLSLSLFLEKSNQKIAESQASLQAAPAPEGFCVALALLPGKKPHPLALQAMPDSNVSLLQRFKKCLICTKAFVKVAPPSDPNELKTLNHLLDV